MGGLRPRPSPLLAVPNVTAHPSTASVPTSYYSMWRYNLPVNSKELIKLCPVYRARRWCRRRRQACWPSPAARSALSSRPPTWFAPVRVVLLSTVVGLLQTAASSRTRRRPVLTTKPPPTMNTASVCSILVSLSLSLPLLKQRYRKGVVITNIIFKIKFYQNLRQAEKSY